MTKEGKESNITDVYINLTDRNDNSPVFTKQSGYQVSCKKTLGIGQVLLNVSTFFMTCEHYNEYFLLPLYKSYRTLRTLFGAKYEMVQISRDNRANFEICK